MRHGMAWQGRVKGAVRSQRAPPIHDASHTWRDIPGPVWSGLPDLLTGRQPALWLVQAQHGTGVSAQPSIFLSCPFFFSFFSLFFLFDVMRWTRYSEQGQSAWWRDLAGL